MSKSVLVLGAGGYIGCGVAAALRRAGYKVFGLVRDEAKAIALRKLEVLPVVANQASPESFRDVAAQCSVIIDAIGWNEHSETTFDSVLSSHRQRVSEHGPSYKPLYIFTSGIMIYGAACIGPLDETILPSPISPGAAKKLQFEGKVLASQEAHGVVIRPGWIYGGQGGHYIDMFFKHDPQATAVTVRGRRDKRWSWVHIDDVSEAYVLAVRQGRRIGGELFNVSARDHPSYEELLLASAKAAGCKIAQVLSEPATAADEWCERSVVINPQKVMDLLGWQPRHQGFLAELDLYYATWKLHHAQ